MPQAPAPVILAVDLGTSGLKVALITTQGQVLGWEAQPVQLYLAPGGGAEQSSEEWWQASFRRALLLARNLTPTHSIRAVCCSTQGEGTVPVDSEGKPLTHCILWMDMRGAPYLRQQVRGLVNFDGADVVKIFNWVRLTGGMPSMTGKDPAGHMLLIRDTLPEIYARTHKFLNVLDYMNLRLAGEFVASADSIVTSWVTDNRHPDRLTYSEGLIHYLGIDRAKLPDIVPCTAIIGKLRAEVAEALGLPARCGSCRFNRQQPPRSGRRGGRLCAAPVPRHVVGWPRMWL
jgi:xylulokinase